MTSAISIEVLLIAARGVALIAALGVFAWAFLRWRTAAQRDTQRLFEQMDMLTGELNTLVFTTRSMSERLDQLHERVDAQSRLTSNAPGPSQRGYEFATRLAKNGASTEDLVASCGISRHEAELLIRLNAAPVDTKTAHAAPAVAKSSGAEPLSPRREKQAGAVVSPPPDKVEQGPRRTRFAVAV
jgi:hypothetical protein